MGVTAAPDKPAAGKPGRETRTRNTDKKGRVTLPSGYADTIVEVEIVDEFEVRVRKVVTIPEREAWLWRNPAALASVMRGIEQAKAGQFVEGPDLDADIGELPGDED